MSGSYSQNTLVNEKDKQADSLSQFSVIHAIIEIFSWLSGSRVASKNSSLRGWKVYRGGGM